MRQPSMGDLFHPVTSDAIVDKPAVFIPAKLIPDHAAAIKTVQPFPLNVPTPFVSRQKSTVW